jgi:hypothetical protein
MQNEWGGARRRPAIVTMTTLESEGPMRTASVARVTTTAATAPGPVEG